MYRPLHDEILVRTLPAVGSGVIDVIEKRAKGTRATVVGVGRAVHSKEIQEGRTVIIDDYTKAVPAGSLVHLKEANIGGFEEE